MGDNKSYHVGTPRLGTFHVAYACKNKKVGLFSALSQVSLGEAKWLARNTHGARAVPETKSQFIWLYRWCAFPATKQLPERSGTAPPARFPLEEEIAQ